METWRGSETPRIGRFALLRPLGKGGMGRVYAAYDERLDRRVAVKVLRDGVSERARLRILHEAKAMARLSHPNVVQVFEVGEHDGRLFIAMEYVHGEPLSTWQKACRPWTEILETYVQAGKGLAAAHAAGLIHRDFKPHNAVVESRDGTVRVKVLDFGIARWGSASADVLETTPTDVEVSATVKLTVTGKLLGTPAYMAPEQFDHGAVDAAADQFSFCVALWEGLYGRRPFAGATAPELVSSILRSEIRRTPVSTEVPERIKEVLLRGLSNRPEKRFASIDDLLDALTVQPSGARSSSWRLWLAGTGGLLAVGAGVASGAGEERCTGADAKLAQAWNAERRAEVEDAVLGSPLPYAQPVWERASGELDGYAQDWSTMYTEVCEATSIRGEQSPEVMDLRMGCLHRAKLELSVVVDALASGDPSVIDNAARVLEQRRPLRRCENVEALLNGEEAVPAELRGGVDLVRTLIAESNVLRISGQPREASLRLEEARSLGADLEYSPLDAELSLAAGRVSRASDHKHRARTQLRKALRLGARNKQWDLVRDAARTMMVLLSEDFQRPGEAEEYRDLLVGLSDGHPELMAEADETWSVVLFEQSRYLEAEETLAGVVAQYEELFGPEDSRVGDARSQLAVCLLKEHKNVEAEVEARRALEILGEALGSDHPRVSQARGILAELLRQRGMFEEAETQIRAAFASRRRVLGREHPELVNYRIQLATIHDSQGKHASAEAELRWLLENPLSDRPANDPFRLNAEWNFSVVLMNRGKNVEAEVHLRRVLAGYRSDLPEQDSRIAEVRHNLAGVLYSLGRVEDAVSELRATIELLTQTAGPDHPSTAVSRMALVDPLVSLGQTAEAAKLAEQAWEVLRNSEAPDGDKAMAAFTHARMLWDGTDDLEQRRRARALALRAQALAARGAPSDPMFRAGLEHWLGEHGP